MNLLLPSVKLIRKARLGPKLRPLDGPAQTRLDRMLGSSGVNWERVVELRALRWRLEPFELGRTIDRRLDRIDSLANRRRSPKSPGPSLAS